MGLAAQQQVRQMYVGTAPNATVTDLATLKSAGVSGDMVVLSPDATAVSSGEGFQLFQKDSLGKVLSSDVILPEQVLYAKSVEGVAEQKAVWTVSDIVADAGTLYTVNIAINHYGSLSAEDTYLKKGFYQAAAADDAEAIVDGLVASLKRNFSREPGANAEENPYFSFAKSGSGASASLVITELDTWAALKFDANKFTRTLMDFYVDVNATTYPTVENTTPSSKGVATGRIVASMEFYLVGERGDFYRSMGYPHDLKNTLYADKDAQYNLIELGYFSEGRDEAKKSKKQITIAIPSDGGAEDDFNAIVTDINTALGVSIASL